MSLNKWMIRHFTCNLGIFFSSIGFLYLGLSDYNAFMNNSISLKMINTSTNYFLIQPPEFLMISNFLFQKNTEECRGGIPGASCVFSFDLWLFQSINLLFLIAFMQNRTFWKSNWSKNGARLLMWGSYSIMN